VGPKGGPKSCVCLWEADCRTERYKHSLSKGPLPLCKGHRVIEPVLNEVFRAAQ
jgi:hypothetical protein